MQTPQEWRLTLRKALFNDDGTDKDVTKTLTPFMKMSAQDSEVEFDFMSAKKLWKKNPTLSEFCFNLVLEQMEGACLEGNRRALTSIDRPIRRLGIWLGRQRQTRRNAG